MIQSPWLLAIEILTRLGLYALMLCSSLIFLRKQQSGSRMMLSGAFVFAVASAPVSLLPLFWKEYLYLPYQLSWILGLIAGTGALLFHIGLLRLAMRRRSQYRRIADLEAILRDREGAA